MHDASLRTTFELMDVPAKRAIQTPLKEEFTTETQHASRRAWHEKLGRCATQRSSALLAHLYLGAPHVRAPPYRAALALPFPPAGRHCGQRGENCPRARDGRVSERGV